jgi:hypothetical protein
MFRPSTLAASASHRAATSPRSDRPGCCRRTARSDGPAPAGRGHRCTSAPPFEDARPAEGGFLTRAASTSPATSGLPAVPGVAALLRVHPSQHQLRLVPGALPPSSPTAFWPVRAGCGCRLLWPLLGVAATRPGTLLQGLFTSKCWLYMPLTTDMSISSGSLGEDQPHGNRPGRQAMAAIGLLADELRQRL